MEVSLLITITFLAGYAAHLLHLPPLIGFLSAGFILHYAGFSEMELVNSAADLGVTLLLFTVGLKLDIRSLFKKEVIGTASLHMLGSLVFFSLCLMAFRFAELPLTSGLEQHSIYLLAFALGFSSTVFAVKALEDKSEMNALYGRVAIGILIIQDIFAVVFLAASTGKLPTLYAPLLLFLWPLRPLFYRLLDRVGHGELQIVLGFFLALVVGAQLFELVGIKSDIGALVMGMLLASHSGANYMAKALFSFKEIMLVAFFLSIGLSYPPSWDAFGIALILCALLFVKNTAYMLLLMFFRLRSRTAFLGAASLGNFSEFGLIVSAIAVKLGWLPGEWMAALAMAVSISFMISAPIHKNADKVYQWLLPVLRRLQRKRLNIEDQPIELGQMQVVILGMGRIGEGAYDLMQQHYPDLVIGIDTDLDKIERQINQGRAVIQGDATDSDFWEKLHPSSELKLVLLAMPHHHGNEYALKQLKKGNFNAKIAAICQFADEAKKLRRLGADEVFNLYNEAGAGFAEHVYNELLSSEKSPQGDKQAGENVRFRA
ncbi:cation:proton antiporter family protein [Aliagarivorans taiwanensis]|uniref:cation:proton antiporter family protein n=1 Tax=Aliagarivorans taiwanensis TaxID=561966 RepID=UPI00040602F5|nr:cation:proton antiporter family protein [Aliagarivorans taiwanensis]